jgi:GH35 family endo-1,4-beta-xylanase
MDNSKEIKNILTEAVNIERWAPKTNNTYSFIDDEEREEMVKNILKYLKEKGYKITKK